MERNDPGPSAAGWAVSAQPFGWWQSGLSKAIRGPSVLSIHFKVLSNGVDGCSSSREPAAAPIPAFRTIAMPMELEAPATFDMPSLRRRPGDAPALLGAEYGWLAPFLSGRPQRCHARRDWVHSTSRITLRRFIRSRACTTSFLSSTARRCSTVRVASRGPGSIYSPRMRLASSTARISVS
jgi:hypothetical protein